jgi:hypothetical protein
MNIPQYIALCLLFEGLGLGCSCQAVPIREAYKAASVVFSGTVVRVDHLRVKETLLPDGRRHISPPDHDDHTVVTFDVHLGWKGPIERLAQVHATVRPSVCDGYRFMLGKTYVVYATETLNQSWDLLGAVRRVDTIWDVADCPLRVRDDVTTESKRLGTGRAPK